MMTGTCWQERLSANGWGQQQRNKRGLKETKYSVGIYIRDSKLFSSRCAPTAHIRPKVQL